MRDTMAAKEKVVRREQGELEVAWVVAKGS